MEKIFFYGAILLTWIIYLLVIGKKQILLRHLLVWIAYSLYSLTYEIIFGIILHLYYYIIPEESAVYILLSSLFFYPVKIVLYILFLPEGRRALWYTAIWILALLALEIVSVLTKTIVFTGWKIMPWSLITYIVTFASVHFYDRYLRKVVGNTQIKGKN